METTTHRTLQVIVKKAIFQLTISITTADCGGSVQPRLSVAVTPAHWARIAGATDCHYLLNRKMDRCPELFELEGFFETAYQSIYGNDKQGWYYDRIRFERCIGGERVMCEMEPAEGIFSVCWTVNGETKINISLQYVKAIDISLSGGEERLIGHVLHDGVDQLFKLAVKPTFSFSLGTG